MMNLKNTSLEILKSAIKRVSSFETGDRVTNICAGEKNPLRLCYFVKLKTKKYTNKYGITHTEYLVNCTNRKGKFWDTGTQFIYPGHLSHLECLELFKPVHASMYGEGHKP